MNRNEVSEIFAIPRQRISLEADLRMFWSWVKYTGFHPDLLMISVEQSRPRGMVRYIYSLFALLLITAFCIYQWVELVIQCRRMVNLAEVVLNMTLAEGFLCVLAMEYQMWSHRSGILQLFHDWKQVEMQSPSINLAEIKRFFNGLKYFTVLHTSIYFPMGFVWVFMDYQQSFFFTHYSVVRETFGLVFPCTVIVFIFYWVSLALIISILIPAIFFNHVTFVVENFAEEWDSKLRSAKYLRMIWQKYEKILHLVNRANTHFGTIILIIYFNFLFTICLMIFYAEEMYRNFDTVFVVIACSVVMELTFLFATNWIFSRILFSPNKLQKLVADELSQKWNQLDEAERHLFVSFLARLEKGDMAVCPMNLFTICPSNLLTILAVIINYFIVLAQSV